MAVNAKKRRITPPLSIGVDVADYSMASVTTVE